MEPTEPRTTVDHSPPLNTTEHQNLTSVTDVLPFWNRGDIPGVLSYYDQDIVWTNVPMEEMYRGHSGVGAYLKRMMTAFPDLHFVVTHKIPRGDRVAERWVISGTHLGPYMGIPPTGKRAEIHGMSIVRLRDGLFLTDRFHFDSNAVMRQLGLFPPAGLFQSVVGTALLGVGSAIARSSSQRELSSEVTFSAPTVREVEQLASNERENLQVVLDAIDHVNHRNLRQLSDLFADNVSIDNKSSGAVQQGKTAVVNDLAQVLDGFPDATISVIQTVVRGNEVACEWSLEGTHDGPFLGVPATGRHVWLPGNTMFTIGDDGIEEMAIYVDSGRLWRQIGLMPPLSVVDTPPVRAALWAMIHPLRVAAGVVASIVILKLLTRRGG